jgi:hypothetical protein
VLLLLAILAPAVGTRLWKPEQAHDDFSRQAVDISPLAPSGTDFGPVAGFGIENWARNIVCTNRNQRKMWQQK